MGNGEVVRHKAGFQAMPLKRLGSDRAYGSEQDFGMLLHGLFRIFRILGDAVDGSAVGVTVDNGIVAERNNLKIITGRTLE